MGLKSIRVFFDFLAKMGLSVRDDPPKVIELSGREWGPEADGFALSIRREPGIVSVVFQNRSDASRILQAPDFARWFRFQVSEPGGPAADLTPFGRQLLRDGNPTPLKRLSLRPGQAMEAHIPIDSIFHLRPDVSYTISASFRPAGMPVTSNTISIR